VRFEKQPGNTITETSLQQVVNFCMRHQRLGWAGQQSMSKCCWLPQLKLPLPLLCFAAAWLAVGAGQGDGGAVCEDKDTAIEGARLISMCGTSPVASFHKHPALISLLDLPHRQPAGR